MLSAFTEQWITSMAYSRIIQGCSDRSTRSQLFYFNLIVFFYWIFKIPLLAAMNLFDCGTLCDICLGKVLYKSALVSYFVSDMYGCVLVQRRPRQGPGRPIWLPGRTGSGVSSATMLLVRDGVLPRLSKQRQRFSCSDKKYKDEEKTETSHKWREETNYLEGPSLECILWPTPVKSRQSLCLVFIDFSLEWGNSCSACSHVKKVFTPILKSCDVAYFSCVKSLDKMLYKESPHEPIIQSILLIMLLFLNTNQ